MTDKPYVLNSLGAYDYDYPDKLNWGDERYATYREAVEASRHPDCHKPELFFDRNGDWQRVPLPPRDYGLTLGLEL